MEGSDAQTEALFQELRGNFTDFAERTAARTMELMEEKANRPASEGVHVEAADQAVLRAAIAVAQANAEGALLAVAKLLSEREG